MTVSIGARSARWQLPHLKALCGPPIHDRVLLRFTALFLLSLLAVLSVCQLSHADDSSAENDAGPAVSHSLASLVTQDGVQVQIAAHEPNVVDPVAARFDEHGRMWVVEMRDYPTGPLDGKSFDGRIVVLSDQNADGVFERSVTFADGLVFPTGLQPWRDGSQDGVIVTLAGKIEFMADRDGDGRCDHREVWFEGFEQDNEQLRANHPTLGPDGRIVVANGLRGGKIRSANDRWSNVGTAIDLRGKDFAFDPRGGFFGAVAGNSQFGLSIDDFGNRVGCSNRNPAVEALFTLDEIDEDRWSVPADALHDIARSAAESEVRAIAQAWTTSHTHAGQFSAACGVTVGLGDAMPASWRDDLVVCEPTAYAVQRQRVRRDGVGRSSTRIETPREMIASRDTWFRPVDTTIGPDGALYVVDMCRAVIEHPNWAPEELKHRPDERFGHRRGRIWRLAETDAPAGSHRQSLPTTIAHWVNRLDHTNPIQRQSATAHLMQADANEVVQAIRVATADPLRWTDVGYARALWLLQIHDAVNVSLLQTASQHPSAEIRRLAVRLMTMMIASQTETKELAEIAIDLLDDSDEWVRFDAVGLVSTLMGQSHQDDGEEKRVTLAAKAIVANVQSHELTPVWMRRLAMTSPRLSAALLGELLSTRTTSDVPATEPLLRLLARRVAFADVPHLDVRLGRQSPLPIDDHVAIAFTAGWCEGDQAASLQTPRRPDIASDNSPDNLVRQLFEQSMHAAALVVADRSAKLERRLSALEVLNALNLDRDEVLRKLVQHPDHERVQSRALVSLLAMNDAATMQWLGENIASLAPPVRAAAIDQCLGNTTNATAVLDWIESNRLPTPLLSIQQSERLQRNSNPLVSGRAKKLFGVARQDRQKVIAEYASSTRGVANMLEGKALFIQHCASCHQIAEQGTAVGPDISDSRTKTPASLLAAILDPNAAIDAGFLAYQALADDGSLTIGTLIDSDAAHVTIQIAGGERLRIARDELELFQTTGVSLMPDGFERSITPDQMRDLLGYLKGWRYLNESTTTIDLSRTARP